MRLEHPASCGGEVGFGILDSAEIYALLACFLLYLLESYACLLFALLTRSPANCESCYEKPAPSAGHGETKA